MSDIEVNPVDDLVQAALDQNYTAATEIFNDQIGLKMQAALDQQKIALADHIFNGYSPDGNAEDDDYVVPEPDDDDEDLDDEDLDVDLSDEELDEIDYEDDEDLED